MNRHPLSASLLAAVLATAAAADIPRTADGMPDLSGYYDVATLTPVDRPRIFGDNAFLTVEQAKEIEERAAKAMAEGSADQPADRGAPPVGGDGSPGAAGNVGGYDSFWIDNGERNFEIDGKFRTSIVFDPPNGRRPAMTPAAQKRAEERRSFWRENTGTAWWLENDGPGPYDDVELRPLAERCLLGFSSTGGPPMMPALYNNHKRIVQTPDHIMILTEMVHDARIVRMNADHAPGEVRRWLGDSVGYWEGDTLVVDTTNFNDTPALGLATRDLHVVERFKRLDEGTLLYSFTVEDPNVWEAPWSGEYPWPATDEPVYEYACHEGNYSLGNIMRGARRLEAEALATGAE